MFLNWAQSEFFKVNIGASRPDLFLGSFFLFKENEYKGSYGRARAWEKIRHLFEKDL